MQARKTMHDHGVANPRIEDGLRTEHSLMAGEMRRRLAGWLPAV